jgi:hypothetical protein
MPAYQEDCALKIFTTARWSVFAVAALGAATVVPAATQSASSQSIVKAIRKGDCDKAVKQMNDAVSSSDAGAYFLAGRLLDEGVCVKQDSAGATSYFKRAFELGDRASALDFGTKLGLGQGVEQSYEHAGEVCRAGGLDAQGKLSTYSLGYACTVRGVASTLLRDSAPRGAFMGGVALVQFTPRSAAMQIRSVPQIARDAPLTGTTVGRPMIDGTATIEKAWGDALAQVPKPDQTKLDGKSIDLPLDLEMTIESGKATRAADQGALLPGEIIPVLHGPPGSQVPGK